VIVAGMGVVAIALMIWMQMRDTRRVKQRRRDAVVHVQEVLTDAEVTQDSIGYPTVRGRYGGHEAKVELIVDTLTIRRLPRLWLAVTLKRPTRITTPVDIVLAPMSTDIVSPGARFPYEHPRPRAWPEHLRVATPQPGPLPGLEDVDALRALLEEPETKSVVIAPRGVRIVTELARGDVGAYRVTRRPDFQVELEAWRLRRVLDDALAVAEGLDRTGDVVEAGV
jgi:hypothetical protein